MAAAAPLGASTARASAAPAKASSTAITAAVAAKILTATIIAVISAVRTSVLLRWIELAKVLRSRSVRFRLALFRFRLRRAGSIQLRLALTRGFVLVTVREISMQRLFVRDALLRGVVRAYGSRLIGAVRVGDRFARQSLHERSRRRKARYLRRGALAHGLVCSLLDFDVAHDAI